MKNTLLSIMSQGRSGRQRSLRDRNSSSKRMLDFGAENGPKLAQFGGHLGDILGPKIDQISMPKTEPEKDPSNKI